MPNHVTSQALSGIRAHCDAFAAAGAVGAFASGTLDRRAHRRCRPARFRGARMPSLGNDLARPLLSLRKGQQAIRRLVVDIVGWSDWLLLVVRARPVIAPAGKPDTTSHRAAIPERCVSIEPSRV